MKLTIYKCDSHDHSEGHLDGVVVWSNDYSYENVLRIADRLGWTVEIVRLSDEDFEDRFA